MPLHEWNSSREWKDDGWLHYELDLKTWVFEESFVPMALPLNGKVYSIVIVKIVRGMNIRIRFSSMLINTPLVQDMPLLLSFISKYIQHIEGIEKLDGWTMVICINYTSIKNHGSFLWIFKRSRTYKNDKEKEFTIHLPLPSSIDKDWGIGWKQITPQLPFNDERFHKIDIDLDTYNSLYDYVNDLIIKGVRELFARGVTIEGVKIKMKKDETDKLIDQLAGG